MDWIESHILQLVYWLDYLSQFLPIILTVAVVFTFFLIQSFSRKLSRMAFYLDRIDNHLREITFVLKNYRSGEKEGEGKSTADDAGPRRETGESADSQRARPEAGAGRRGGRSAMA
ncbi:MAG TPA: hypothetical protein VJ417_00740 [Candidatus Glassbacteria bacterium]|nr:hypothetical protein [Candidatus Glassbacteria bacterium]